MAESSDDLLREAVSLLRDIRDRLDRADGMRQPMLDQLGDAVYSCILNTIDPDDDLPRVGSGRRRINKKKKPNR